MNDTVGGRRSEAGEGARAQHQLLHARDQGSGEAVVLLHAFPLDARLWESVATTLAASHRIITPDLRGFGQSQADAWPSTLAEHADDIASLLKQRGIARATVVGLSMGGYVALALLRRHAHLVARLGLVDARAAADSPEVRAAREQNIALVEQQGVAALVERMLPQLLSATASDELRGAVRRMGAEQPAGAVCAALRAMRDRTDATDLVRALTMPTAIIVGEADASFPLAEARHLAGLNRLVELDVIEKAGHLSPCEAPARFTSALARLLQRSG